VTVLSVTIVPAGKPEAEICREIWALGSASERVGAVKKKLVLPLVSIVVWPIIGVGSVDATVIPVSDNEPVFPPALVSDALSVSRSSAMRVDIGTLRLQVPFDWTVAVPNERTLSDTWTVSPATTDNPAASVTEPLIVAVAEDEA